MYNVVKIGKKEVPMLSMASVDLYFKNIFHEDPVVIQTNMETGDAIGFYQRMGFVMAKFAEIKERKEMLKLTEDAYIDWLDGFERNDLLQALEYIQQTYDGQQVTYSDAKKKSEEPSVE